MEERYPFLAYWKKTGINKFSKLVDDPEIFGLFIIQHIERYPDIFKGPALKAYREKQQDPAFKVLAELGNPLLNAFFQGPSEQEVWEKLIRPNLVKPFLESLERMSNKRIHRVLDETYSTIREILYDGKSVNEKAEELGRSLLSEYQARGGKVFKTKFHTEIIKLMYEEMRRAIIEIRQAVAIPCTIRSNDIWVNDDETKLILKDVPGCNKIFDRKELPKMTVKSSVADCAVLIIRDRLKSSCLPPKLPPQTLKRLLQKR